MFLKKYTNKSYTQMLDELGSPASETTYTIEKAPTKGWNHHELFKLYPRNNTNKNVLIKEVSWSDGDYVIMACFHLVKDQYQCIVTKRIKVGVRF